MDRVELEHELERLHPACYGWALGCCRRDHEEAEDVLQIVYLNILEGKARFDGRSSLKTWLFAVIRRTAASERRRRWLRALFFDPTDAMVPPEGSRRLEQSETTQLVVRALDELPPRQREILELVFYHELTVDEAAVTLGISAGSARTHYHRGKQKLSTRLNGMVTR